MTAGCARCGACCDPVGFTRARWDEVTRWSSAALDGVPDPADDEGWAAWVDGGWPDDHRDTAVYRFSPDGRWRQDADFIAAHWTPAGEDYCACDMFDPATRLCTAHDARPPVCANFPWYAGGPAPERGGALDPQCSYLADLPPRDRPGGSRPLIPVTVIRRAA